MKRLHLDRTYRRFFYVSQAPFKFTPWFKIGYRTSLHGWSMSWLYWDWGWVNMNRVIATTQQESPVSEKR